MVAHRTQVDCLSLKVSHSHQHRRGRHACRSRVGTRPNAHCWAMARGCAARSGHLHDLRSHAMSCRSPSCGTRTLSSKTWRRTRAFVACDRAYGSWALECLVARVWFRRDEQATLCFMCFHVNNGCAKRPGTSTSGRSCRDSEGLAPHEPELTANRSGGNVL